MGVWDATVPTFTPGQLRASNLQTLADIASALSGALTPYSCTWTSTATNPSLGDGTLDAAYLQIGRLVFVNIRLTTGATTTYGTGIYTFTFPVAGVSNQIISTSFSDASASLRYGGIVLVPVTTVGGRLILSDGTLGASPTAPVTWAAGDVIVIEGWYRCP